MVEIFIRVKLSFSTIGAILTILFMAILMFSATVMIKGYSELANEISIYGFFFLVPGVILQLVGFFRKS